MEHSKKMILIEPCVLESLRESSSGPPVPDATSQSLKEMDKSMRDILDKKDEDENVRSDSYQQVLWRFLKRFGQYRDRPLGKVEMSQANKEEEEKDDAAPGDTEKETEHLSRIEKRVVDSVPKTLKKKAQLLLDIMKDSAHIEWNEQGQLVYQGRTVEGTNMADLVNDALHYRKNAPDPRGWEMFAQALKTTNVPRKLIGHPGRWEWMHGKGGEGDRGRQPTRNRQRRRRIVTPSPTSPFSAERVSYPSPSPKKRTWLSYP